MKTTPAEWTDAQQHEARHWILDIYTEVCRERLNAEKLNHATDIAHLIINTTETVAECLDTLNLNYGKIREPTPQKGRHPADTGGDRPSEGQTVAVHELQRVAAQLHINEPLNPAHDGYNEALRDLVVRATLHAATEKPQDHHGRTGDT